jgi:FtsH-binding integral membrane protein
LVCLFISFYFSFLSFQAVDENAKKQLVLVAAFSIIAGATIFACFLVYIGIRKVFAKVETGVKEAEEPLQNN